MPRNKTPKKNSTPKKSDLDKCLNVQTGEGQVHSVPIRVLNKFGMIKSILESGDYNPDDIIQLTQVRSECFQTIVEWTRQQVAFEDTSSDHGNGQAIGSGQSINHGKSTGSGQSSNHGDSSINGHGDNFVDHRVTDIPLCDIVFIQSLTREEVFEMMEACNYLQLELLLQYLCKTVANWMEKLTVEEIWTEFGIVSDFTPEENEEIKNENSWAEEAAFK